MKETIDPIRSNIAKNQKIDSDGKLISQSRSYSLILSSIENFDIILTS